MAEPALNAVVVAKTILSDRQIILRVATDGGPLPEFTPGQFAVLGLPASAPRCSWCEPEVRLPDPRAMIRRAYSIASSSQVHQYLEFYISLVSDGALTPRLFALARGDRLWLSPKIAGIFTLDRVARGRNIVLVATGSGLAPYMSMLRTEMECGGERRFVVLDGALHSWDLGYRSELLSLDRFSDRFSYLEILDDPQGEPVPWRGPTGRVQDLWRSGAIERAAGFKPSPADTEVFLCGHPDMIRDMLEVLGGEGYREWSPRREGQVHVERY
jgi:ferredoxin--NADP+ reductase